MRGKRRIKCRKNNLKVYCLFKQCYGKPVLHKKFSIPHGTKRLVSLTGAAAKHGR